MPKNFLIVFAAREGSTAIVSHLSTLKNFQVPVMEELDAFWIREFYENALNLEDTFETVFSTATLDLPDMWGRSEFLYYDPDKPANLGRENLSVGFKWRPHGDFERIIDVLKSHDVQVLYLVRSDFKELVCSLYLSNVKRNGKRLGHAQFELAKAGKAGSDKAEELLSELNNISIESRPWSLLNICARRLARTFLNVRFVRKCQKAGLNTDILHYEDFAEDPQEFFQSLTKKLDNSTDPDPSANVTKPLKKVARVPAKERVKGIDSGLNATVLSLSSSLYARLLNRLR